MVFSSIEFLIPKPLPFLKIGLSNIPILSATAFLNIKEMLFLLVFKTFCQSVIQGTLLGFPFVNSLISSIFSGFSIYCLKKLFCGNISFIGLSLIGALVNNLTQILLINFFIFSFNGWIIGFPFILSGLFTAFITGYLAERIDLQMFNER